MQRVTILALIFCTALIAPAQQASLASQYDQRAKPAYDEQSGPAPPADVSPGAVGESEQNEIYNLEHRFGEALVKKDKHFLTEHLADNLVEIAWNGLVFTKSKLLSDLGYIDVQQYKISNVKFRELDRGAVLLTYDLEIAANAAGHDAPSREYASSVWVKRDGRWLLQMHQSTPADH